MDFTEIVKKCDESTQSKIIRWIEEAHGLKLCDDYSAEYDDITPCLFEEIGRAIYDSVFQK